MLVLGLDQGGIGTAATAFADSQEVMVHAKFDKIHRIIRDVKLSLTHCCRGVFLLLELGSTQTHAQALPSTGRCP